jgi:hypothetical protein
MEAQRHLTRLYFWGVVVIGVLLFGLAWFVAEEWSGDTSERLFALFASIGASALWWAAFARVAEREIYALVKDQIADERQLADNARQVEVELLKAELERLAGVGDDLPAAVYPGKTQADLRFNHDLDNHLDTTTRYLFWGPTAVYVGARLTHRRSTKRLKTVEVTVTDPRSEAAMKHAVMDRLKRPDHIDKHPEEVEAELRKDIFMAIIALFDSRDCAQRVRILLEKRAAGVRVELFDRALYDSSVESTERKNFTHTLRWDSDQPAFKARERQMRNSRHASLTIERTTREPELLEWLTELGMPPGDLPRLRETYRTEYIDKLERVLSHARTFSEELADDE